MRKALATLTLLLLGPLLLFGCESESSNPDYSYSQVKEQQRFDRAAQRKARIAQARRERRAAIRRAKRKAARQARRAARIEARQAAAAEAAAEAAAAEAAAAEAAAAEAASTPDCHPSYSGACLDPNMYDYDCAGGSGDGPGYTGMVTVVGDDPYDLDRDGDGVGCE